MMVFGVARWVALLGRRRERDDVLETQRPSRLLGRMGGPSLGAWRHPLLMVGTDPLEVDQLLTGGELRCPDCTGELRPWGHARERVVRDATCVVALRPRRSWCTQCRCTHVLLPASTLVRRADTVAVIGRALLAKAAGAGHRRVAALLDRPVSTVRGWLRRFGVRAESLRVLFTALLHALDASAAAEGVTGSLFKQPRDPSPDRRVRHQQEHRRRSLSPSRRHRGHDRLTTRTTARPRTPPVSDRRGSPLPTGRRQRT